MNTTPPVSTPLRPHLVRRLSAEFLGTAALVTIVVGSGIAASRLSPTDVGLQLLQNSLATGLGLFVLILVMGPVSGAHLNPVVTIADWWLNRRTLHGFPGRDVLPYLLSQMTGGICGTLVASIMFEVAPSLSDTDRTSSGSLVAEVVATAGLIVTIFALAKRSNLTVSAAAVGAYITAAYWFTSSTSFANPAVTIARLFTDTFAGIAPSSVLPFIAAQGAGMLLGALTIFFLYPSASRVAQAAVPRAAATSL